MSDSQGADQAPDRKWSKDEVAGMSAMAFFFSQLLLHECDAPWLAELEENGVIEELREIGLQLPASTDDERIEALAAEYFETLLNPAEGTPLVQSLALEGTYEGDAAKSMREIARAANVRYDPKKAEGAPVDHLGSQLELWARIVRRDQKAAREFTHRHLLWALPHLDQRVNPEFYGQLATRVAQFIRTLPVP